MTHPQNITVLTAISNNTVKTFYIDKEGLLKCQPYGKEYLFNHKQVQVSNIADLANQLTTLSKKKNAILIRGTATPGLYQPTDRKKEKFPEAKDGCHWVMIDFDNLSVPEGMNPNSTEALNYYAQKLPREFHHVSYFYQFSSSAGILNPDGTPLKNGLNAHLFFWFDRPVNGKKLSAYFELHCYKSGFYKKGFTKKKHPHIYHGVDLSVITSSVQPHYIGLPILLKGVTCTLPPEDRQGLVKKIRHVVDLPEFDASLIPETLSTRRRVLNSWKEECGQVSKRITTRAAHGGISVSSYYCNPNGPSPSSNKIFLEAKSYGENDNSIILYFDGEHSPGSFYVKKSSPQLAIRFGDYSSMPLKELSDGAYAYVRDELKWFSEISYVELPLTEAGYVPDITSFVTSRNSLIVAPTGSGKTEAFCRYAETKNGVIFYAAQTIALVDQMYSKLKRWNHGEDNSPLKNYIPATRYSHFHQGKQLETKHRMVYVTTNESLGKFIEAAISQGINYEFVCDEIHVALDDFMATNAKNELLERAISRATRSIFMTGTITNLQISKLLDTISRACGTLTPEVYTSYQFHPVKSNPLYLANVRNFGADFVALLRKYRALKNAGKPIPRTVVITPTTKMRKYEMLLANFELSEDSCIVSRQESLQDVIEIARMSTLPILVSSPLFALGLNFEVPAARFWTYFSHLQVDQSQIIQTLNRANRDSRAELCEVRLYHGELDSNPVSIPKAELAKIKIEEYLLDEASVQGVLDAHFQIDRTTYLSMREAEKKTAKSLHSLITEDGFQNYHIVENWVDDLDATKEDKEIFDKLELDARNSYLNDVINYADRYEHEADSLLLYFLEKLFLKKREFGESVVQVARDFQSQERGLCMALCGVSAKDSVSVKPARIRRLFGELTPCEFPAHRSHFTFGVIAPLNCRRNGATLFPA